MNDENPVGESKLEFQKSAEGCACEMDRDKDVAQESLFWPGFFYAVNSEEAELLEARLSIALEADDINGDIGLGKGPCLLAEPGIIRIQAPCDDAYAAKGWFHL
jgi:hypothetical protein